MTSNEVMIIKAKGVSCKSDAGLYFEYGYGSYLRVLSLYGSPQQVRAIFALLVGGNYIEVSSGGADFIEITAYYKDSLRLKTFTFGYGKRHALIYSENLTKDTIIWVSPEGKQRAILSALSKRRIPFDESWIGMIEKILIEEDIFIPLQGWGGLGGYLCRWNDDEICNLIVEKILRRRREWNFGVSSRSMAYSSPPG